MHVSPWSDVEDHEVRLATIKRSVLTRGRHTDLPERLRSIKSSIAVLPKAVARPQVVGVADPLLAVECFVNYGPAFERAANEPRSQFFNLLEKVFQRLQHLAVSNIELRLDAVLT